MQKHASRFGWRIAARLDAGGRSRALTRAPAHFVAPDAWVSGAVRKA